MALPADFHMPGAYHFEPVSGTGQALSAGIFRPPVSPSASSYNLGKSTGSLYSDISMATTPAGGTIKRKRAATRESTPTGWNMDMDGANEARDDDRTAGSGRQIRYTLAGQINVTPGGFQSGGDNMNGRLEDSVYSDVDYRRALGPKNAPDECESPSVQLADSGLGLHKPSQPNSAGWSTFAFSTLGGVMGKVWEFCKNGAFRGFQAGGGEAYDVNGSTVSQTGKAWGDNDNDLPTPLQTYHTPFDPGNREYSNQPRTDYFAQSPLEFTPQPQPDYRSYSPQYREISTPDPTSRPAAKRRQTSECKDELVRNWVLVDEPQDPKPRSFASSLPRVPPHRPAETIRSRQSGGYSSQHHVASSPGRRMSVPVSRLGASTPTFHRSARTSLRMSRSGSPSPTLIRREPASFAQPRTPVTHFTPQLTTPSRIPVPAPQQQLPQLPQPQHQQHSRPSPLSFTSGIPLPSSRPTSRQSMRMHSPVMPSPSPIKSYHHRRRESNASVASTMRRSLIDPNEIVASPRLDAEAKHLAQRKLAAERDTDKNIDAFNARLLNMIRQGKEALGTTVEVLDDGGGGGGVGAGGGGGGGGIAGMWESDDEIL
ncbi:hypothetical protein B0T17DRAFT_613616 [Bombardia bombarda]|uniref:Uncharacterized protein n=1 Tax=Bombardia bombarda TaxID=252184 RepID=A0AA39XPW4_9PEZI|nr:hypothetical protein B0T17DRAFT_613616 [Bombardia bombarda]